MNAIETIKLTKKFDKLTAVDGVDLTIEEGEFFGFLGPNGAGKTTTISMLSTILRPTSGSANVWGYDIVKEQDKVRKSIGVVFQEPSVDDDLTGMENLEFHARLYKVPKDTMASRTKELLELMELTDRSKDLMKTYSGGMRRRLEIARGLLHHPKVLFLDEPTLGLDPQTRRLIWKYIDKLNKVENVTMLLTTHYMDEADYLCNRIAIIDNGKIVACDTPANLKDGMGGDIITLTLSTPPPANSEKIKKAKKDLENLGRVLSVSLVKDTIKLTASKGETLIPPALNVLRDNKIDVRSVSLHEPTLEDVFIKFTGRKLRDEVEGNKQHMVKAMKQHRRFRH
ncbi:MAG: ATP-binding cassette domain-containing protein [Thermoplasmata archaeon]|nr:MAG: ATP-binding cassette domain-containing protein [Thermoplasmata archaeon]